MKTDYGLTERDIRAILDQMEQEDRWEEERRQEFLRSLEEEEESLEDYLASLNVNENGTVDSFAKDHPEGTYIVSVAHHVVAVVDGCYWDTWDSGYKSLYGYYEKVSEPETKI